MIQKPCILITSIGRTGTEFFARFFADILPESTSLHEPDIFQNTGVEDRWGHYLGQVRRAGVWRMVVLKALGRWTLVKLSDDRFSGRLTPNAAARLLEQQRSAFIARMKGQPYVEANIGYYALLDIVPGVFAQQRAIYLVRDGRDWIRSHMNWGEFYGKQGPRKWISNNWPTAPEVEDGNHAVQWSGYSRFEKLCWAWARLNSFGLDCASRNPNARVFRFEDIFQADRRYKFLGDLVDHAVSGLGIEPSRIGRFDGWLEKRIHPSTDGFPDWSEWGRERQDFFGQVCGALMQKTGYHLD